MSDNSNFGFAQLIPGFDFLQNLAKGTTANMPQMPSLSNWVAPTLNVDELEKRIADLKAVHFWLDQNSKALGATIQALEVQKMTLATLRGMNFNMGELANALQMKTPEMGAMQKASETTAREAADAAHAKAKEKAARPAAAQKEDKGAGAAAIDPLQWWGSLTQQFQQIAANAMKDVAQKSAAPAAAGTAPAAPAKKTARKAPARKTRGKTSS